MKDELVFDIETKKSFDEVGGRQNFHLLGVSVVGVYSYKDDSFVAYEEKDFPELEQRLADTSRIIGFNSKHFDVPVLQPHVGISLKDILHLDLMEGVEQGAGFRVSLDSLAGATLGTQKSGHGLEAIKWWNEGNIDAIKKYCLDDVRITRDLYEYGKKNGRVMFKSRATGKLVSVNVDWQLDPTHQLNIQTKLF
jgi:DEAD/DEAH box helicase domain-containing protein